MRAAEVMATSPLTGGEPEFKQVRVRHTTTPV